MLINVVLHKHDRITFTVTCYKFSTFGSINWTQPPLECSWVNSNKPIFVPLSSTLGLLPSPHQRKPYRDIGGSWDRVVSVFLTAHRVRTSQSQLKLLEGNILQSTLLLKLLYGIYPLNLLEKRTEAQTGIYYMR